MKKFAPLFIIITLTSSVFVYSQSAVCESKNESSLDVNTISINKCEIEEKKSPARKINRTKPIRKRVNKRLRKTSNHFNSNNSSISLKIKSNDDNLKLPSSSKEVLFTLVEEIPMFESCVNSSREENVKCFKTKINNHFSKNFYAEKFIDETFKDKIFIQFTIDIYGKVKNLKIKSKNKNKRLHKELLRIVDKFPRFQAGKEKGLPVPVTYSFPLNLTLN